MSTLAPELLLSVPTLLTLVWLFPPHPEHALPEVCQGESSQYDVSLGLPTSMSISQSLSSDLSIDGRICK